nr:hypothetical protein [Tanacetum cinerariifolium]
MGYSCNLCIGSNNLLSKVITRLQMIFGNHLGRKSSFYRALILSKPVRKTTHVSLASSVISRPSSSAAYPRGKQDPVNPGLAAYGPRVSPSFLQPHLPFLLLSFRTALKLVCFLLQEGRAIVMPWRHHDSSVVDPFPKPKEFNESDAERLREKHARYVPILKGLKGKANTLILVAYLLFLLNRRVMRLVVYLLVSFVFVVLTMAEFLRIPNFQGYKVDVGALMPNSVALETHLAPLANRRRKRRKLRQIAAKANDDAQAKKVTGKRRVGERKLPARRERHAKGLPINLDSEHHVADGAPIMNMMPRTLFLNEEVPDGSAIKRSCRLLCKSAQQQANVLLRFESLTEEHANLIYAHESCKETKARYKECKKELGRLKSAYNENADRIKQLEEELKKSEEDTHQLRVDREKYAVECGNKEMAILAATSNVDPASSAIFIEEYEKLFTKRYPYVDKFARAYLFDPFGLQNVMPDEIGPTPAQGPRTTLMTSYA